MPKGLSLHVGLNAVDPHHYDGWDGALRGCENDARDMQALAKAAGYETSLLLTNSASSSALLRALTQAARTLKSGDTFLLTYSGHGGQVPDVNGDEDDGLDETWVLYDRMVVDDELYAAWSRFADGVRIVVLSDSCHSGTVTRFAAYAELHETNALRAQLLPDTRYKAIPADKAMAVYRQHRDVYDSVQLLTLGDRTAVEASVLLISGCQDSQLSGDGPRNGVFTEQVLRVWDGGKFKGDYASFHRSILRGMPSTQAPNLFTAGKSDPSFVTARPFAIAPTRGRELTDGPVRFEVSMSDDIRVASEEEALRIIEERCVPAMMDAWRSKLRASRDARDATVTMSGTADNHGNASATVGVSIRL